MRLNAPKQVVFFICVCLIVLGLLSVLIPTIPVISGLGYWLTFAGGALLALACLLKGL